MKTGLTLLQTNILDSDVKTDISWLFEIDKDGDGDVDYYWSTKAKTWNGQAYTYKVMNFSDLKLERNKIESRMFATSRFSFSITNQNVTLRESDFTANAKLTLRLVVAANLSPALPPDGSVTVSTDITTTTPVTAEAEIYSWSFDITSVEGEYQQLRFECRDWLAKYLEGTYPNTKKVTDVFSTFGELDDSWCCPELFGDYICDTFPVVHGEVYAGSYTLSCNGFSFPGGYVFNAAAKSLTISGYLSGIEVGDSLTIAGWPTAIVNDGTYSVASITTSAPPSVVSTIVMNEALVGNETLSANQNMSITITDPLLTGVDISFTALTSTISKPSGGLNRLSAGRVIIVSGSTLNNKCFLVETVSNTAITVSGNTIVEESAGDSVVIKELATGILLNTAVSSVADSPYTNTMAGGMSYWNKAYAPSGFFASGSRTEWDAQGILSDFQHILWGTPPTERYEGLQIYGIDTAGDGRYNKKVIYMDGGKFPPIPVNTAGLYQSLALVNTNHTPADILRVILVRMGVPLANIDLTSLAAVAATHVTYGLTWGLALTRYERRVDLLSRLLAIANVELVVRDKIYFKIHSKVSQLSIEQNLVQPGSFSSRRFTTEQPDAAYVITSYRRPPDEAKQYLVSAKGATANISKEVLNTMPVRGTSASSDVDKSIILGTLYYQRKFLPCGEISAKFKGKILQVEPDDVITINPMNYGAGTGYEYPVLIDSMTISKDLSISLVATRFSQALDDWADITPVTQEYTPSPQENLAYTAVVSGPDASGQTGDQIPNLLRGALRIGATGNYIHIDPVEPLMKMSEGEGEVVRLKLGDLGTDDWGFELFDHAGTSIMRLDGTSANNNRLSGWKLNQYSLTDPSGVVGLSAEVTVGVDWRFWAGNATPASAPFRVDESGNLYASSATISGMITGSYVYGSSLMTKGTYLASSCLAADATLNVGDTTDFPASGSASFIDSANDRDSFAYTGKTATTLTGCSGVLAHTVSTSNKPLVVPVVKGIYISDAVNELRFWGDRGDGIIEEIANIGIAADYGVGKFGNANCTRCAVYGRSLDNTGIRGESTSSFGIQGVSDSGVGVSGQSQSNYGLYGLSGTGYGIYGTSGLNYSIYSDGTTYLGGNATIKDGSFIGLGAAKGRIQFDDEATDTITFLNGYPIVQLDAALLGQFQRITTTTGAAYIQIQNGMRTYLGSESSVGATIVAGTLPYSTFLCSIDGYPIHLCIGNAPYLTVGATGGVHIGGTSDPGDNNLLVDGTLQVDGISTFINSGLHILDTNASHDLIITPGSDLSADRILTLTTGDAARTVTLSGNPTLDDWFDQSVKQAASPTFASITIGGAVVGTWTTPDFDAANFTASGAMTWTVAAGDCGTYAYTIINKTMIVSFNIFTTTVGGTLGSTLYIKIPASKTATKQMINSCYISDNGVASTGFAVVAASATNISICLSGVGNWTASTNNTAVSGQITFEIN